MEKVVITGGTGFLGTYLTEKLLEKENPPEVTLFDNQFRDSGSGRFTDVSEVDMVQGDVRNLEKLTDITEDVDTVLHLAAINGTKKFYEMPEEVLDVNVKGTQNVIEAAKENNVDRVGFTSSSEVYGFPSEFPTPERHELQIMDVENPRFSYAGSKIIGEQLLIHNSNESGFDYTIVRPHNFYGPKMGYDHVIPEFIERLVKGKEFTVYGDGKQTRSFCHIDDGVRGVLKAFEMDAGRNEIFNIGNSNEITINKLAEKLIEISDRNPDIVYQESEELEGSVNRRQPDVSRAKELLGYSPKVKLEEGLKRTYKWYRNDFNR